mgnify:CR=1 FL=1
MNKANENIRMVTILYYVARSDTGALTSSIGETPVICVTPPSVDKAASHCHALHI